MDFYLHDEQDTLSSALRPILERRHPDEFVASARAHPLDTFVRVTAPSEAALRAALLEIKEKIAAAKKAVAPDGRPPLSTPSAPAPPRSATPAERTAENAPRRSDRVHAARA
jgi:DNA-directed RNA polymerase subunit L